MSKLTFFENQNVFQNAVCAVTLEYDSYEMSKLIYFKN